MSAHPLPLRDRPPAAGPGVATLRRGRGTVSVPAWYYPRSGRLFVQHPTLGWVDAATREPAVLRDDQPFALITCPAGASVMPGRTPPPAPAEDADAAAP